MSDYSLMKIVNSMLDDPSFYLMAIAIFLLLLHRNFWVSLSAIGLFFYCEPYFMTVSILPFAYQESSGLSVDEFAEQVINGFAAVGILMILFGFYKLVTEFEKSNTRRG